VKDFGGAVRVASTYERPLNSRNPWQLLQIAQQLDHARQQQLRGYLLWKLSGHVFAPGLLKVSCYISSKNRQNGLTRTRGDASIEIVFRQTGRPNRDKSVYTRLQLPKVVAKFGGEYSQLFHDPFRLVVL